LIRTAIVPDPEKKLLRTYLSLDFHNVQNYVLILESDFLGDLFEWSHQAISMGSVLCDLRLLRTHNSPCFAFLTGPNAKTLEPLIKTLKHDNERVTLIEEPTSGLVDFMSILP
jgi:hypothetical protein